MGLMLAALCALAVVLVTIVAARFRNAALTRITTAQGMQEHAYITLGGIEQYVQIRGEDRRNPVILWLHGGPGFPLTYMTGHYQTELEHIFPDRKSVTWPTPIYAAIFRGCLWI